MFLICSLKTIASPMLFTWQFYSQLLMTTLQRSLLQSKRDIIEGIHDDVIKWNHFRITGALCGELTSPGEFPAQRPVTRSFGVFFDLRLNKRLSKQSWGWWFETPPWSLWRQYNDEIWDITTLKYHVNITNHMIKNQLSYSFMVPCSQQARVSYFTKEVNISWLKPPLNFNDNFV